MSFEEKVLVRAIVRRVNPESGMPDVVDVEKLGGSYAEVNYPNEVFRDDDYRLIPNGKHTDLEILLARALWQHAYLLSTIYLNLGKKNIPIFYEMEKRMKAIPRREQRWLNSPEITDGQE